MFVLRDMLKLCFWSEDDKRNFTSRLCLEIGILWDAACDHWPETCSLFRIGLSCSHMKHFRTILYLYMRILLEIAEPERILWCPSIGGNQNIIVSIFQIDQGCCTLLTTFSTNGHQQKQRSSSYTSSDDPLCTPIEMNMHVCDKAMETGRMVFFDLLTICRHCSTPIFPLSYFCT